MTLSNTVMPLNICEVRNVRAGLGPGSRRPDGAAIRSPSSRTSPLSGWCTPQMTLSNVDLPAPSETPVSADVLLRARRDPRRRAPAVSPSAAPRREARVSWIKSRSHGRRSDDLDGPDRIAIEICNNVLERLRPIIAIHAIRDVTKVRHQEGVGQSAQHVVPRQRLDVEHVEDPRRRSSCCATRRQAPPRTRDLHRAKC